MAIKKPLHGPPGVDPFAFRGGLRSGFTPSYVGSLSESLSDSMVMTESLGAEVGTADGSDPKQIVISRVFLDGGTQNISNIPVRHPTRYYDSRVLSNGVINRSVSLPPDLPQTSSAKIVVIDTDLTWRQLLAPKTARRRRIETRIGSEGQSETAFQTVYSGQIQRATFPPGQVNIDYLDSFFSWMDESIPNLISPANFPNLPDGTQKAFFPIVFGENSSVGFGNQGTMAPPYVDTVNFRYAVSRISPLAGPIAVLQKLSTDTSYDVVAPIEYFFFTQTMTIDGVTYDCVFLQFTSDKSDYDIRLDVNGIKDLAAFGTLPAFRDGGLARNAVDLALTMLFLASFKFTAIDIFTGPYDYASFQRAWDVCDQNALHCDGVIDEDLTWGAFFGRWSSSTGISIYNNRNGKIALAIPGDQVGTPPELDDVRYLYRESIQQDMLERTFNRIIYSYGRLYGWAGNALHDAQWGAQYTYDSVDDQIALGGSGDPIIEEDTREFWFVRERATGNWVTNEILKYFALDTLVITGVVPLPPNISRLELAFDIFLTHYGGVKSGGFTQERCTVQALSHDLDKLETTFVAIRKAVIDVPAILLTVYRNDVEIGSITINSDDTDGSGNPIFVSQGRQGLLVAVAGSPPVFFEALSVGNVSETFEDVFDRADADTLGTDYVESQTNSTGGPSFHISGGLLRILQDILGDPGFSIAIATPKSSVSGVTQFSEFTYSSGIEDGDFAGVFVSGTSVNGPQFKGYFLNVQETFVELYFIDATVTDGLVYLLLSINTTVAEGDRFRIGVIQTTRVEPPPPSTGCTDLGWAYQAPDPTALSLHCLAWSPELAILVAGGNGTTTATTTDAETWTAHTAATTNATNAIVWSADFSMFVGVGQVGRTRTSVNGIVWSENTQLGSLRTHNAVCYSTELGLFVMTASNVNAVCVWTSTNGTSWTPITTPVTTQSCRGIVWAAGLGLFVVCGTAGLIMTSPDGATWTIQSTPNTYIWTDITWSPTLGLLVACSSTRTGADNRMLTSTNATAWTLGSDPVHPAGDYTFSSISWSPTLEMFAAIGSGSTDSNSNGVAAHSLDGLSWHIDVAAAPNRYDFVESADELRLFVGINQIDSGGGFLIGSCADEITSRLELKINGVVAISADIASSEDTWIPNGRIGLRNDGSQGVVNPSDIASWDNLSITGSGGYTFTDDFNRADADDLGVDYVTDQIGDFDPAFHIVSNRYQNWINSGAAPTSAVSYPADCPVAMTDQSIELELAAFGAGIGVTQPSQMAEFCARMTGPFISQSYQYYAVFQANRLDPTSGYCAVYHVYFPDTDPANGVYTLIDELSNVPIDIGDVVSFSVTDV